MVDDDAVSRHVLANTLSASGLPNILCSSGEEALEYLAKAPPPSVVLLDLVMPEPDGYAVLRYLRNHPRLAEIPVVVITPLDSADDIERMFARGVDDYVHKPFRPAELVARLRVQMRVKDYVERLSRRERDQQTVLELTQTLASTLDIAFKISLQVTGPFIIYAILVNVLFGILGKLIPQVPSYFISIPFLLMGGLFFLYLMEPEMLRIYFDAFNTTLTNL